MSEVKDDTVSLKIDGKEVKANPGSSIIEAADEAGIFIPRFCYHKKLSIAANCRMCLVDVENARKPTPACATPVSEGMVIRTKSEKTRAYQKTVMEFLLINHPLDCPICDQGGQCELQDMAMGYGKGRSQYTYSKRVVSDPDIGPLIATDLTRCIHCTRCVRFGVEISGQKDFGMTHRGEHAKIATAVGHMATSELSGNVIDLCPVGALTSKPGRYKGRPWEMHQHATISPFDAMGANVYAHIDFGKIQHVVPRENESINEIWLADRDRFAYVGNDHPDRIEKPMIKYNGQWEEVSWEEALTAVQKQVQKTVNDQSKGELGAILGYSNTTEVYYLMQKICRTLGSSHIDYRIRQQDFDSSVSPHMPIVNVPLDQVSQADFIWVIGSDLRQEVPLMHQKIRAAQLDGAKVSLLNLSAYDEKFACDRWIVDYQQWPLSLLEVLAHLITLKEVDKELSLQIQTLWAGRTIGKSAKAIAKALIKAKNPMIFSGHLMSRHPQASKLQAFFHLILNIAGAKGGQITEGGNSAGAWLAGAFPQSKFSKQTQEGGWNALQMLSNPTLLKTCFLVDIEPHLDTLWGRKTIENLAQVEGVIALASYQSEALKACADIILPVASHYETSGSMINMAGQWQSFKGVKRPVGESRPCWKVLRVIANMLELPGFDYDDTQQVLQDVKAHLEDVQVVPQTIDLPKSMEELEPGLIRVPVVPLYSTHAVVRHAHPLQNTYQAIKAQQAIVSKGLAKKLGCQSGDCIEIQQGEGRCELTLYIDPLMSDQCIVVPFGSIKTQSLNILHDNILVKKVNG